MKDLTNKTVTLPIGIVVTVAGKHRSGKYLCECVSDDGTSYMVLDRVIRELPVTHRRAELQPTDLTGTWPESWHRY